MQYNRGITIRCRRGSIKFYEKHRYQVSGKFHEVQYRAATAGCRRGWNKGKRVWSSVWSTSFRITLANLLSKLNLQQEDKDALLFEVEKVEGAETMAHARCANGSQGVKFIHQVFGLFRVEEPMSELFRLSSSAWRAYATRNGCEYKLWTADEVDTLIQLEAPEWLRKFYSEVMYPVQRVDVASFFILWKYGGLYADLGTFPNLETYPLVSLGFCRMPGTTPAISHEWATDVVVATHCNRLILYLLWDFSLSIGTVHTFRSEPNRLKHILADGLSTYFSYVSKFNPHYGCKPQVATFSMCNVADGTHLSLDDTGRVLCHLAVETGMVSYDVWSAFYSPPLLAGPPPTLARPLAQLPPYPNKRRRYFVKTKVDQQTIPGYEPQPNAPPDNPADEPQLAMICRAVSHNILASMATRT